MRILFTGIIARYPFGGATWCSLLYLLTRRALGHGVYLTSVGPALVQDTGWTAHLPHGDGLIAFSTPEDALAGSDRIHSQYGHHAKSPGEIARACYAADGILTRLLDTACS
jgi:hypothetical protein